MRIIFEEAIMFPNFFFLVDTAQFSDLLITVDPIFAFSVLLLSQQIMQKLNLV